MFGLVRVVSAYCRVVSASVLLQMLHFSSVVCVYVSLSGGLLLCGMMREVG